MTKRQLLYSAAFVGLVAAAGVSIPQAQAQKGMALEPSTQWAINKVAGSAGNSDYCAMARRYRPNTVLTFARNSNEESSLALDFQTPKFRQGDAMEVLIDPGAGEQRAFEVYPVSNQAFVIRLGDDKPFFAALNKTGFLRVEFGEKTYNFDLSDIDAGQMRLASCVAESISPSAGDEGSPVLSDNSFQRDIDDLRRQIAQLKETNVQLAAAPVEKVIAEKPKDKETEFDRKDSIVVEQLSQQITMLEAENQQLEEKLKVFEAPDYKGMRSAEDSAMIDNLHKENNDLKAALETEQAGDIQEEVLHKQINALQDENTRLRDVLAKAESVSDNAEKFIKVSEENNILRKQLIASSENEIKSAELQEQIASLEQENQDLKKKQTSAETQAAAESNLKQIAALKAENKRLQYVVQNSEVSGDPAVIVKELKMQVQKLSDEGKSKDDKILEMGKLATEVEMLKTTNEELEKQLIETALKGPVTRKEAMTHKVAALETQNDALLQKIQDNTNAAQEATAVDIDALKAENDKLKQTIAENQTLVESTKKMQSDLETLRKENDALKEQAKLVADGEVAVKLQKALDDNKTLQTALQQKENQLVEMRAEVERLKKENEALKAGAAPTDISAAAPSPGPNPEVETLTRENESLRSQIAGMGAKDTEIADLKAKLQEQEAKITAAEDATKKAETDAKAAQKEAQAAAKKAAESAKVESEVKAKHEASAEIPAVPQPVEKEKIAAAKVDPAPAQAASKGAVQAPVENEMVRLENKLSEAKASGDQMAIQKAAREYMDLKTKMSASQELAQSSAESDQTKALLEYAGSAQAPVGDVSAESNMNAVAPRPPEMSEAQKQEDAMRNAPPAITAKTEEKLTARASEDPFADIKVDDEFTGYESVAGGSVKEQGADNSANVVNEKAAEAYRARMNDTQGKTAAATTPEMAPPPPKAGWAEATKADAKVSNDGIYHPDVAVPQLLEQAHVVQPEGVSVVQSATGGDKVSYQWTADKVYGSATQQPLSDPSRFDMEVQNYLDQTKKRCGEDFAAMPNEDKQSGGKRIATYEIACVGKGISSSASLIFFSQKGTFTVLAHEAPAENLENAMEIRDRLVKTISGS